MKNHALTLFRRRPFAIAICYILTRQVGDRETTHQEPTARLTPCKIRICNRKFVNVGGSGFWAWWQSSPCRWDRLRLLAGALSVPTLARVADDLPQSSARLPLSIALVTVMITTRRTSLPIVMRLLDVNSLTSLNLVLTYELSFPAMRALPEDAAGGRCSALVPDGDLA